MATRVRKRRPAKTSTSKKPAKAGIITEIPGPDELTEPSNDFSSYCTMVFGESAIGKTSTLANAAGALVIQLDPLREDLRIRQVAVEQPDIKDLVKADAEFTPFDQFVAYLQAADEDDTVKVVIVDNFQRLYNLAKQHVLYKLGIEDPNEDQRRGLIWDDFDNTLEMTLNAFREAGNGLILISHGHYREITPPLGEKFDRWEPELSPRAMKYPKANCTFVFNYIMVEGKRVIMVRAKDEGAFVKCCNDESLPRFCDPDGNPITYVDAGNSPKQAWDNLNRSFNNELYDAFYKPPTEKKPRRRRKSS